MNFVLQIQKSVWTVFQTNALLAIKGKFISLPPAVKHHDIDEFAYKIKTPSQKCKIFLIHALKPLHNSGSGSSTAVADTSQAVLSRL